MAPLEGTTTDGQGVLRFIPRCSQPAIDARSQVTPFSIRYELDDGIVGQEVCWWGDVPSLPHVWNLLGKKASAHHRFGEPLLASGDRKRLSQTLHDKVLCLDRGNGPVRRQTRPV